MGAFCFYKLIIMAVVYVLYSNSINRFYIGSCANMDKRLVEHNTNFRSAFTSRANDWKLYYVIEDLEYQQARKIEAHIKRMKSRKYIENLKTYPEITTNLKTKYQ